MGSVVTLITLLIPLLVVFVGAILKRSYENKSIRSRAETLKIYYEAVARRKDASIDQHPLEKAIDFEILLLSGKSRSLTRKYLYQRLGFKTPILGYLALVLFVTGSIASAVLYFDVIERIQSLSSSVDADRILAAKVAVVTYLFVIGALLFDRIILWMAKVYSGNVRYTLTKHEYIDCRVPSSPKHPIPEGSERKE